jgi:hypothetical protein
MKPVNRFLDAAVQIYIQERPYKTKGIMMRAVAYIHKTGEII